MGAFIVVLSAAGMEPGTIKDTPPIAPEWITDTLTWIILGVAVAVVVASVRIGMWVGTVNTDRRSFNEFMTELRADIKEILLRTKPTPVAGSSPLRLTDLGEKIAKRLDANKIVERIILEVQDRAKGKSAYEIQELSSKFFLNDYLPEEEEESLIQECAFENGIDREQVLRVLVVVLRDRLLSQAPIDGGDQ